MKELHKNVTLLYIMHNDYLLTRKFLHQDYEVLDVFSVKNDDTLEKSITSKLNNLFGKTFPYSYYGDIESIINKKDVAGEAIAVHIHIETYKIFIDEKFPVLDSYTDDVVTSPDQVIWVHKDTLSKESRLRAGDKRTLTRIFDEKKIHIKIVEDQGDRWIDAKTTLYEDY